MPPRLNEEVIFCFGLWFMCVSLFVCQTLPPMTLSPGLNEEVIFCFGLWFWCVSMFVHLTLPMTLAVY